MTDLSPNTRGWAARVWRQHQPTPTDRTLTDWTTSTAADGRPLHTARVDHPDARHLLHRAAEHFDKSQLSAITQEHPHLDIHAPGRVALVWLLNGEWIELWAPNPSRIPLTKENAATRPAVAAFVETAALNSSSP
ncbi:hypothetical protein QIS99_26145 [Streptomyces sp. B-S-A8]|uniref:Uncharacterized protein n=1 Tax=Streptomyces solicavernae TaxID=3043614 RepID=A0ABT6RYX5_9ACTN|nr:hypothetical protein [Streptomyces sp. B-S-A8]MDI3389642.1 hypothetical protein [Streptomyces sp. B-S-A8]